MHTDKNSKFRKPRPQNPKPQPSPDSPPPSANGTLDSINSSNNRAVIVGSTSNDHTYPPTTNHDTQDDGGDNHDVGSATLKKVKWFFCFPLIQTKPRRSPSPSH